MIAEENHHHRTVELTQLFEEILERHIRGLHAAKVLVEYCNRLLAAPIAGHVVCLELLGNVTPAVTAMVLHGHIEDELG